MVQYNNVLSLLLVAGVQIVTYPLFPAVTQALHQKNSLSHLMMMQTAQIRILQLLQYQRQEWKGVVEIGEKSFELMKDLKRYLIILYKEMKLVIAVVLIVRDVTFTCRHKAPYLSQGCVKVFQPCQRCPASDNEHC